MVLSNVCDAAQEFKGGRKNASHFSDFDQA